MSGAGDDLPGRLDRVAGVSLRVPIEAYRVDGLSFGGATLTREPGSGRWASLALILGPDAAEGSRKSGGSDAAKVTFPLQFALVGTEATFVLARDLRGLLVDHELLSRPGWLTDAAPTDPPADDAARASLDRLRASLSRATGRSWVCPSCARPTDVTVGQNVSLSLLQRLGLLRGTVGAQATPATLECPHAPMRREAWLALWEAFPELAFEAALVLIAAPTLRPARFVLSPALMPALLGAWLMNAHQDPFASSTGGPAASAVTSSQELSAQAWCFGEALPPVAPAGVAAPDAVPVLHARPSPPAVTLLWPDGVARPAPPEVEAAAPKPARRRASSKGPPTEPAPAIAESPAAPVPPLAGQEMMTSELRSLGYTDARIKRLVADGSLERASYGWFRWRVSPPAP